MISTKLKDQSRFTLTDEDGKTVTYSAEEAYELGIAYNRFKVLHCDSDDYELKKINDIKYQVIFNSPGTKEIELRVTLKDGKIIKKTIDI